jgi:hypothetical protein
MALTETSYPVTGTIGFYQNTFPSQQPQYIEVNRLDAVISSIVSGTDNVVRMAVVGTFTDVQIGQFVAWNTDAYGLRSSRVTAIIDASTIEVDQVFFSTNVSNGFVNYHRNYFIEIRYVIFNSVTDDQDALLLIDDFSQVPNNPNGDVKANISAPAQLLVPEITEGIATGLFIEYKIQYRESYDGNRSAAWVSPDLDIPIMLVHASGAIELNNFTDTEITKRFIKGYPLVYSLIYSDVNDNGVNSLSIKMTELSLSKVFIAETEIVALINFNGVYIAVVDPSDIDDQTAFITFSYDLTASSAQYDPSQYDPSQYA